MYIKLVVWSMKLAFITLGIQLWFFTKPRVCDATVRGNHDGRPCNRCERGRGGERGGGGGFGAHLVFLILIGYFGLVSGLLGFAFVYRPRQAQSNTCVA